MNENELLHAIRTTPWHLMKGAYGSSERVGAALEVLLSCRDADGDDWNDAVNGTLLAHVWHQGTIHEVTPAVVSLLLVILEHGQLARRADVANALGLMAESAGHGGSRWAEQCVSVLEAQAPMLERWLDGDNFEAAMFISLQLPGLRAALPAMLERHTSTWQAFIALAELDPPPAWAFERATAKLTSSLELERLAAGALLRRHGRQGVELPDDIVRRLDAALELPFTIVVPRPQGPLSTRSATVIFAGPSMVVARLDEGANVTLRWAASGAAKGDRLEVGLTPDGQPRFVIRNGERTAL
jgi:hypothetical protein